MPTPLPTRRLLVLLGLALVACVEPLPPVTVDFPPLPNTYPTTFLRGRVTELGTDTPLAGVVVSREATQSVTNAEGIYSLAIVDGYQVLMVLSKAGYDTARVTLQVNGGDQVWNARLTKQ